MMNRRSFLRAVATTAAVLATVGLPSAAKAITGKLGRVQGFVFFEVIQRYHRGGVKGAWFGLENVDDVQTELRDYGFQPAVTWRDPVTGERRSVRALMTRRVQQAWVVGHDIVRHHGYPRDASFVDDAGRLWRFVNPVWVPA